MTSRLNSGMSPLTHEVDVDERLDEGVLVVHVELEDLGLAGRQLGGHLSQPGPRSCRPERPSSLRDAGDGPRGHLTDGTDAELKYAHAITLLREGPGTWTL